MTRPVRMSVSWNTDQMKMQTCDKNQWKL
jgi:hypothetical protein